MTPEGYKKLQEEFKHLKSVERPKNVLDIETARAHGDLSENAEYSAAKERQSHIAMRLVEVEDKIARAQVIDPSQIDHSKIVYQIVGVTESDVPKGKISVASPIAKSLIGKETGDVVRVVTPRGTREFEVLEIAYQ